MISASCTERPASFLRPLSVYLYLCTDRGTSDSIFRLATTQPTRGGTDAHALLANKTFHNAMGERLSQPCLLPADYGLVHPTPITDRKCTPPCSKSLPRVTFPPWVDHRARVVPPMLGATLNWSPRSHHRDHSRWTYAVPVQGTDASPKHATESTPTVSRWRFSFHQRTRLVAMFGNRNIAVFLCVALLRRRMGCPWSAALYDRSLRLDGYKDEGTNSDSGGLACG